MSDLNATERPLHELAVIVNANCRYPYRLDDCPQDSFGNYDPSDELLKARDDEH